MGLVRDFKVWVIGNILWFTGLCLFVPVCCSGSHIFQTVAVLSASLRLEFVHLLRSVVRTRGLPRACLSRVVSGCTSSFWSAVHFNEGGSGASVLSGTVSYQMRCQFNTLDQSALLLRDAQAHQTVATTFFGWMDGWMGLNLCAKWSCDHTRFMAKHLVIHRLHQGGWGRNEILKLE